VNLLSALVSIVSDPRIRGVVLGSVVLVAPAVIAAGASAGSILLALFAITAAVFLERRPRATRRISQVTRLAPVPARLRAGPQARWELVEREGRSSLVMRWR
jgi:hypothetical protein